MQKIIFIICNILSIFLIISCSENPVITETENTGNPIVLSLVSPDLPIMEVYVGNSLPESEIEDINSANVIISSMTESFYLKSKGSGFYRSQDNQIQPGTRYYLTVETIGKRTLTAHTDVPGLVSIENVHPGDTLTYFVDNNKSNEFSIKMTGPSIRLKRVQNAAIFLIFFQIAKLPDGFHFYQWAHADTVAEAPQISFLFAPTIPEPDSTLSVKLVVCALDSNYYNNFEAYSDYGLKCETNSSDPRERFQPFPYNRVDNIQNGIGLFGSFTYQSVPVVLKLFQEK